MATIEYANGKISDEEHVLLLVVVGLTIKNLPTIGPNITSREDGFEVGSVE